MPRYIAQMNYNNDCKIMFLLTESNKKKFDFIGQRYDIIEEVKKICKDSLKSESHKESWKLLIGKSGKTYKIFADHSICF